MKEEVHKAFKNGTKEEIAKALKDYYIKTGAGRRNGLNVQNVLSYEAEVDAIFDIAS